MKQEIPIRMDNKTSEDEIFLITIRIEKKRTSLIHEVSYKKKELSTSRKSLDLPLGFWWGSCCSSF